MTTGQRWRCFLLGVGLSIALLGAGSLVTSGGPVDHHRQVDLPWVDQWDCSHTTDCNSTP